MFMNNFARRTGSAVFKNRRMMSAGHQSEAEVEKEMAKWYKMTIGEYFFPACGINIMDVFKRISLTFKCFIFLF